MGGKNRVLRPVHLSSWCRSEQAHSHFHFPMPQDPSYFIAEIGLSCGRFRRCTPLPSDYYNRLASFAKPQPPPRTTLPELLVNIFSGKEGGGERSSSAVFSGHWCPLRIRQALIAHAWSSSRVRVLHAGRKRSAWRPAVL